MEKDIKEHLLNSDFLPINGKFSGAISDAVDIKLTGQGNVVVYVYDRQAKVIMTIIGKVESIDENKHD